MVLRVCKPDRYQATGEMVQERSLDHMQVKFIKPLKITEMEPEMRRYRSSGPIIQTCNYQFADTDRKLITTDVTAPAAINTNKLFLLCSSHSVVSSGLTEEPGFKVHIQVQPVPLQDQVLDDILSLQLHIVEVNHQLNLHYRSSTDELMLSCISHGSLSSLWFY